MCYPKDWRLVVPAQNTATANKFEIKTGIPVTRRRGGSQSSDHQKLMNSLRDMKPGQCFDYELRDVDADDTKREVSRGRGAVTYAVGRHIEEENPNFTYSSSYLPEEHVIRVWRLEDGALDDPQPKGRNRTKQSTRSRRQAA